MNIKKLSLAVAGALLVVGCASNQGAVKPVIKADDDSIKPKPVSAVFHRPEGNFTIELDNGKFVSITFSGTASQQGNNGPSGDEATKVAENRAYAVLGRFIKSEVTSTRNTKILSTAVQKSLENTTNGMGDEDKNRVVDDETFDVNGDPKVTTRAYNDGTKDQGPLPVKEGGPNTNTQKIAEINRENITIMSRAFVKGVKCNNGVLDSTNRYITVTCTTGVVNTNVANELARTWGNN